MGRSWASLVRFLAACWHSWSFFGRSLCVLGRFGVDFGGFGARLGWVWEPPGGVCSMLFCANEPALRTGSGCIKHSKNHGFYCMDRTLRFSREDAKDNDERVKALSGRGFSPDRA